MALATKQATAQWQWHEGNERTHAELKVRGNEDGDSILYHGADWAIKPANKRLIEAAPELLAAIKYCLQFENEISPTLWKRLNAALAVAKGE